MFRPLALAAAAAGATLTLAVATAGAASTAPLPPLKAQPTAAAVVKEHLSALNACDWNRLMAQYTNKSQIHLPAGVVVKGRKAIGELFAGFVKPHAEGGLCGITFSSEKTFKVDGTISIQWVANAPFLKKPYRGSDAYITKTGFMLGMVSTFDGAALKFK
jgi:hypothetical protein